MVRLLLAVLCIAPGLAPLPGATLQWLSMDDLAGKATAIVRGRVSGAHAAFQGSTIYTHYQIDVLERWKGVTGSTVDLMLPGGVAAGYRQTFSGVPQLVPGKEYMLFLWTGKSGNTQLMGLSQGMFEVFQDSSGQTMATRPATSEMMLDATGHPVQDQPVRMRLLDLAGLVLKNSTKSGGQ
ncbi:MAG: hypothetical protein M3Y07_08165 [Acidobacteriota bacterium]|nr:hypothetical protein [Acidobacteriota bacterium]